MLFIIDHIKLVSGNSKWILLMRRIKNRNIILGIKKILIPLFLVFSSSLSATTYYVSTSGSDSNNGLTQATPWKTLGWAEDHATAPGDIIALKRGDEWSSTNALGITHGGADGNPIIWDGSLWGSGANAIISASGNHPDPSGAKDQGGAAIVCITHAKNVTFQNITIDGKNYYCYGWVVGGDPSMAQAWDQGGEQNLILQDCVIKNIGGSRYALGVLVKTWTGDMSDIIIRRNTVTNIASWGISIYMGKSEDGVPYQGHCERVYVGYNTVTDCEMAHYDMGACIGVSLWVTDIVIEHNTITQGNGRPVAGLGVSGWDGVVPTGVVIRYNDVRMNNLPALVTENGLAIEADIYYNMFYGKSAVASGGGLIWLFYPTLNMTGAKINFYNNTIVTEDGNAFINDIPSNMGTIVTFKNNIVVNNASSGYSCFYTGSPVVHSNNNFYRSGAGDLLYVIDGSKYVYKSGATSWESTCVASDPLFVDRAGFNWHLQAASPAIGKGVAISGLTQDFEGVSVGNPPNMGCFESLGSSPPPVYRSSVIENATPSLLEMTYNISLANIVPAASAFTVTVNSVNRSVNSVAIVSGKVQLTLASPVVYGDVITVAYNKPAVNSLQSVTGETAASISAQPVTNNCISQSLEYISAVVQNATPSILEMTYSLTLANILPAVSAFVVVVNSVSRTVNSVSISGNKVRLTLASPVVFGDVVTVAYTKPANNYLQTSTGLTAASMNAQPVTNNCVSNIPVYQSSVIQNATPTILEMTYDLTLANIVPAISAFTVRVNSVVRNITSVSISGNKVSLTLSSAVVYGDVITVTYTKPSSLFLQTPSGGAASSISSQPVTNNCTLPVPVYISSVVEDATPTTLEMTYDRTLANIIPSAFSFTVRVNSVRRSVTAVAINGSKVLLTLASPIYNGDIITVSYSVPYSNPLQSIAGGLAAAISNRPVTNKCYSNSYPVAPNYVSSSVEDATPTIVEMVFDATLANIIPGVSAFTVRVNSVIRTINSVSISNNRGRLTLTSAIMYGDVVTVAYTKPANNPLQTSSGGEAESLTPQPVTNNINEISSVNSPFYVSSVVQNATPSLLQITYDKTLNNSIIPPLSAFVVRVNMITVSVNSITISGTIVRLTLAENIEYGDNVTVSYTIPATNPLQSPTGYLAASYSFKPVTNNVNYTPVIVNPVYFSSVVQNATPTILEMTYSLPLASIAPAASAFNVRVNSVSVAINSVAIVSGKVRLTLSNPIVYGDVITVSYTRPSTNPLQTPEGGVASTMGAQAVTNNVALVVVNIPPVIQIRHDSISYSGFVYDLDASQSYDENNDFLTYNWSVPENIPVSSTNNSKIQFLSPLVNSTYTTDFSLVVNDTKSNESKIVPVTIMPYKPEMPVAVVKSIGASDFSEPDSPDNVIDNDPETNWSSNGQDQWLVFKLANPYQISHIALSFPSGQKRSYYFDLLASSDSLSWESVLTNIESCSFAWNYQVFDFPESFSSTEYSYIKFVGHGNVEDTWNNLSEFKIFGNPHTEEVQLTVYPNPARDNVTVEIDYPNGSPVNELTSQNRNLRIFNTAGIQVSEKVLEAGNNKIQFPISFKSGIYFISLMSRGLTIASQKLVVIH